MEPIYPGMDSFLNDTYVFIRRLFGGVSDTATSVGTNADKFSLLSILNWTPLRIFSIFISFIAFAGIVYVLIRIYEVHKDDREAFQRYFYKPSPKEVKSTRWQHVTELFLAADPAMWRLAIIEADAMLDDLIMRLGYPGETMGERMKKISPSDFPTIDIAWEAHKVRNSIAHEGSNYKLSRSDANRIYRYYETIFRDSGYI